MIKWDPSKGYKDPVPYPNALDLIYMDSDPDIKYFMGPKICYISVFFAS